MKNFYRLLIVSVLLVFLSACAGKKIELDRDLLSSQKIETVRIDQVSNSIGSQKSTVAKKVGPFAGVGGALVSRAIDLRTNAKRTKKLAPLAEALGDYDISKQLEGALKKHLKGNTFADELNLDTSFDPKDKTKPYLVPKVTPIAVMAANYSKVSVELEVATYLNQDAKRPNRESYISEYVLDSQGEKVSKKDNFQYWTDNPDLLIEQLNILIDESASKFALDFNSPTPLVEEITN